MKLVLWPEFQHLKPVSSKNQNVREVRMRSELPELSEYQLDCLQKFVRFEFPIETLRKVLAPLVTFTLDGPATHHTVRYSGGIPKNPVKVTRADIDSAIEKGRAGEITQPQLQQWASILLLLNDAFDWSGEDEDAIANMLASLSS